MEFIFSLLPFALIMLLMYFMMIRPQKKAQEKTQSMLSSLKKGDAVVTIGGLHGLIDEVREAEKTVVIDCEGIFLTFERRAIARVVTSATTDAVDVLGDNTPTNTDSNEM
ncbi:preprotein translocase subunit YajC [Desemzia sp. C1]|uniref:Protein translocase subunit yajC n=1 Tax=Desemzia incerta TaxID=82801 RepID=A0A1I5W1E5_9LACT|nr:MULTISPECIES: preprotein translocase subunit YajC [Desemzia]MCI3029343.1 preprotein translocase subunit YajC [Desemzia sp. C1]SFQ13407.1 protein translocase subunit yajC [Desemzia incerta]